jgi:NAD-dependent deacetylase
MDEQLARAAEYVRGAERLVVLSGAGVSAESGVPTFRGAEGLWEGHAITDVASPAGFRRDPQTVWRFYNQRRAHLVPIVPNPGHLALVELERRWGQRFVLVTQNVDGLHRLAGSQRMLELHGNLRWVRCTHCSYRAERGLEPLGDLPRCATCSALLRPDIVWFGEALDENVWGTALLAVQECSCLIVAGTSAVVYPAAGLIPLARRSGARVIEVNLTRAADTDSVDVALEGPSGVVLPELVRRLGGD